MTDELRHERWRPLEGVARRAVNQLATVKMVLPMAVTVSVWARVVMVMVMVMVIDRDKEGVVVMNYDRQMITREVYTTLYLLPVRYYIISITSMILYAVLTIVTSCWLVHIKVHINAAIDSRRYHRCTRMCVPHAFMHTYAAPGSFFLLWRSALGSWLPSRGQQLGSAS